MSEEVVKCREALGEDDVLGRHIKLHSFSTGSHAKLMLADDGRGGVVGCVGSCNWLSTGFGSLDVSVRFRDPNVAAEIASYLSQLARTPNGHASRLTNDLAGFASQSSPVAGSGGRRREIRNVGDVCVGGGPQCLCPTCAERGAQTHRGHEPPA